MTVATTPTRDGRIWSFSSSYEAYLVVLFTDSKISLFDPNGSVVSSNLVTDPTFINGTVNWTERTTGEVSQVIFDEANTRLKPQAADQEMLNNGDFSEGGLFWPETLVGDATASFLNSKATLTSGAGAADYATISQFVLINNTGTNHTIEADIESGTCTLFVGTTAGASDLVNESAWDGSSESFVPTGTTYVTIRSNGSGAVVVLNSVSLTDTTDGSAGIAQSITTTSGGSEHVVRVGTSGNAQYRVRVGTSEGDGTYLDTYTSADRGEFTFTPAGNYWVTVDAESVDVLVTSVLSYVNSDSADLTFNTPYLNQDINDLYFVVVPDPSPQVATEGDTNTLYVLHPNYAPYKLTRDSNGVYNFAQVSFSNAPSNWTGTNWPACGTYFQGRLWLAATPNRGQRFWASKSNEPENFDQGTALDDESLEFTLNELGRIEWMAATKNLVIGTTYGEHLVGAQDGVITPGDIQVELQSSYGSRSIQPILIGDEILFVSPDGKKVYATQYDFTKDNWIARNTTFFSEHITESGIRNWAWAQHPDQLLWCALDNGDAAVFNYERGENVYGWSKQTTDGFYRDFASANLNGNSIVLALTQRENNSMYLEIQDEDVYMDSYIDVTASSATTSFSGFGHLAGLRVQVLLDGATHPDVVVAEDGTITTEREGIRCEAGLAYTSTLETLPLDVRAPSGSGQAYQKRYDQLLVTFLDSALPIINGERQPERSPSTPMGQREPNSDGLLQTSQVTLGWSQDATVTIEQDLPFACTILSIAGRLAMEKL